MICFLTEWLNCLQFVVYLRYSLIVNHEIASSAKLIVMRFRGLVGGLTGRGKWERMDKDGKKW